MDFYAWYWSFSIVTIVLYIALIVWFLNGWQNIASFKNNAWVFTTKVSVIVPFYNEEKHLTACITGLVQQQIQTNELEIILVNDHSNDSSSAIVKEFAGKYRRVKYIETDMRGKKHALLKGIETAQGELIVTTDADCSHQATWLSVLVGYYELHKPNLIIGPVVMTGGNTLFQKFQRLEFAGLVASGAGAAGIGHPIMCNGANLAFSKSTFNTLNDPYDLRYSSGDDLFLMHSMKEVDADKVHFIKSAEAIVATSTKRSIKAFFNQRFRWASKAPGYTDNDTKFTALVIFASAFLMVLGFVLLVFDIQFWEPLLFLVLLKSFTDFLFLQNTASFFKSEKLLKWVPLFELLYGFYVVVSVFSIVFIPLKKALFGNRMGK